MAVSDCHRFMASVSVFTTETRRHGCISKDGQAALEVSYNCKSGNSEYDRVSMSSSKVASILGHLLPEPLPHTLDTVSSLTSHYYCLLL